MVWRSLVRGYRSRECTFLCWLSVRLSCELVAAVSASKVVHDSLPLSEKLFMRRLRTPHVHDLDVKATLWHQVLKLQGEHHERTGHVPPVRDQVDRGDSAMPVLAKLFDENLDVSERVGALVVELDNIQGGRTAVCATGKQLQVLAIVRVPGDHQRCLQTHGRLDRCVDATGGRPSVLVRATEHGNNRVVHSHLLTSLSFRPSAASGEISDMRDPSARCARSG